MANPIVAFPRMQRETHAPPAIIYLRRSTDDDERQVASLPRQREEIEATFGPVPDRFVFEDRESGAGWDRTGLNQMYRWCKLHEKAPDEPVGAILVWDESRFGRPVNERMTAVDLAKYDREVARFLALGWELRSVREERARTGNDTVDRVLRVLQQNEAGSKLVTMSKDVKSGIDHLRKEGYWPGGMAPFPSVRVLADTGEVIPDGARYPQRRQVLGLDPKRPELLQAWIDGAHMLLDGKSFRLVAAEFERRGIPTSHANAKRKANRFRGKPTWNPTSIRKVYECESLIGKIVHKREGKAMFEREEATLYDAKWPPLVPVALWNAVQVELGRRAKKAPKRTARSSEDAILRPVCPHCGNFYTHAHERKKGRRERRLYRHLEPTNGMSRERRASLERSGCSGYVVEAEILETRVRDLIAAERGSDRFQEHIDALLKDTDNVLSDAQAVVRRIAVEIEGIDAELKATRRLQIKAEARADDEEVAALEELVAELRAKKKRAEGELRVAQDRCNEASQGELSIRARIKETRSIIEKWDLATPEEKRKLLAWWVHEVHIVVTERARRKRTNKVALVRLRTNPLMQEIDLRPGDDGYSPAKEGDTPSAPVPHNGDLG